MNRKWSKACGLVYQKFLWSHSSQIMNKSENHFTFLTTCNVSDISFVIPNLFRDGKHKSHRVAALVIHCVLLLSTISLNGISIITIRKSSQLKNKVCYFVVLLQSVVDFSVGVLGIPLFICYLIFSLLDNAKCIFIAMAVGALNITCGLSIATQTAMTMERYFGVLYPYIYQTTITNKRILIYVSANAVILLSIIAYSFHDRSPTLIVMMVYIILSFSLTAFAYTKIYLVIRMLTRIKRKPACETDGNQNVARRRIFQEIRHAKSCFLVLLCFIFFLLPFMLWPVVLHNSSIDFNIYYTWSLTIFISNSSINSVIFFWTKTLLRSEAFKVIKSLCSWDAGKKGFWQKSIMLRILSACEDDWYGKYFIEILNTAPWETG